MANEDITEAEVWADLDKVYMTGERMPGDIDTRQIMERYGISDSNARRRMLMLESSGDWELVWIRDETCSIGQRRVLRKVKK